MAILRWLPSHFSTGETFYATNTVSFSLAATKLLLLPIGTVNANRSLSAMYRMLLTCIAQSSMVPTEADDNRKSCCVAVTDVHLNTFHEKRLTLYATDHIIKNIKPNA